MFARVASNLPYVAYSCRGTPISLRDYLGAVSWPTGISTLAAVGATAASVAYLKLVALPGQPLPPLWKVLPISWQEMLTVLMLKSVVWVGLMIVMIALIPAVQEAVFTKPKNLLLRLFKKKEAIPDTT
jgi:hypothetical protein